MSRNLSQNKGLSLIELTLPYPPSINGYWRTFKGRQIISKRGREYRIKGLAWIAPCEPMTGRLSMTIELFPPDRRRRDIDSPLKALLDLLTHARVYEDDSQIKHLEVFMREETIGKVVVSVKQL